MKKNNKGLILAVTASILAGAYMPSAFAAESADTYKTTITGNVDKDAEYKANGVLQDDGSYLFTKDSVIKDVETAIKAEQNLKINAKDKNLNLNINSTRDGRGIDIGNGHDLQLDAKNLKIVVNSSGETIGIKAANKTGDKSEVVINGNVSVNLTAQASENTGNKYIGIYDNGNSEITINGDVSMKNGNNYGIIVKGDSDQSYSTAAGIMAEDGGKINVNGNVDLKIKGSGVTAYGTGSEVNLKGASIEVDKNWVTQSNKLGDRIVYTYSLASKGGIINVNMNDTKNGAGDNDVKIKGNIGLFGKDGTINLALSGSEYDSYFKGVVYKKGENANLNLYLSDGATWTNEYYGRTDENKISNKNELKGFKGSEVENLVGGSDPKHIGGIFQKDKHNLKINNCSGNVVVVYDRKGYGTKTEDYIGGDTVIGHAAEGTVVTLSTSTLAGDKNHETFIDVENTSENTLNAILNGLAGKLVYEGYVSGERNLIGKVQIASGLSASSYGKVVGDITFNEETGRGSHTYEPDYDFRNALNGVSSSDGPYVNAGVVKEEGKYIFDGKKNVNIIGDNFNTIQLERDTIVNVGEERDLNLTVKTFDRSGTGILIYNNGADLDLTAKNINIDVESVDSAVGIGVNNSSGDRSIADIKGDVNITAKGKTTTFSAGIWSCGNSEITVHGDVTMEKYGSWGIMHEEHQQPGYYSCAGILAERRNNMGGKITIDGDVNLKIKGSGATAYGVGTEINLNGGTIITDPKFAYYEDSQGTRYADVYSLVSKGGTINMNMNGTKDGADKHTVELEGNIGFYGNGYFSTDVKESTINLGLSNKESSLKGVVVNNLEADDKAVANFNLYLSNGATWTNEYHGNNQKAIEKFQGSTVEKLVGGVDKDHAGYIVQKDSNKLTVNNYSGHSVVVYEHTGDGSKAEDYAAGNTIIKNATEGSEIVLSTDNSGITMTDDTAVANTLNTLAGKLYYEAYVNGEKNLNGKVQIAGGLTASSVAEKIGDIEFKAENGQGGLKEGSVIDPDKPNPEPPTPPTPGPDPEPEPPTPPTPGPDPDIEHGDYETLMMQGSRTAMTDAMLSWRDTAADSFVRNGEMRNGAEAGAWVRVYGGETKYEGNKTTVNGNYYAVQAGFDKDFANGWNAGVMFDYKDGESDYILGGEGDYETYGFGVYGSKDMGDGGYLDLSAKVGQVENESSVYNEIGQRLDGKYKATSYSISAQYGKRIENGNSYLEPQLQLTWAHVNGDNYDAHCGNAVMNIDQDAFDSLVGRVGIEAGKTNDKGSLFARLSLNHEFAGDVDGEYYAKDGGRKTTSFDVAGTWSELTLGGNYNLSKCSNFYADITKTLSGDYKQDWKLNAGFSFTF